MTKIIQVMRDSDGYTCGLDSAGNYLKLQGGVWKVIIPAKEDVTEPELHLLDWQDLKKTGIMINQYGTVYYPYQRFKAQLIAQIYIGLAPIMSASHKNIIAEAAEIAEMIMEEVHNND